MTALVEADGRTGALVAVCCTSERLSRSGVFVDYTRRICRHVLERAPRSVAELAGQDWSYEGGTVAEAQRRFAEEVQEAVCVKGIARFTQPEGRVWSWIHPDSKSGVLLSLVTSARPEELREVAFQLAGQILVERCGELVMGESGPVELFDAAELAAAPWARHPERTVAEVLERRLGEGTRLAGYARFQVG